MIVRGLCGLTVVGADVVEIAPAYDHAETTATLASNLVFELVTMMTINRNNEAVQTGPSDGG